MRETSETDRISTDGAAIAALCARYLDLADHRDGPIHDLFVDDAELTLGLKVIVGRSAINDFFALRAAEYDRSGRFTRHIAGAPHVRFIGSDCVQARSSAVVFAGTGALPQRTALPATICDFVDEIVRNVHGVWQFASRRADVIFSGEGAAQFAVAPVISGAN